MARTHKQVRYLPEGERKQHTPESAALGKVQRFSELERSISGISQKMLTQQLRQMERDGIVRRIVHHQVPPKVEYCLTDWGQALCPVLDELLKWAERRGPRDGTL